ncbi:Outer membrane lipoprotein Omp16 precursor [Pseudovibrio axinellae]|uniref:Peptidoglycan-associated lipoprotein n=1 Tax=Pseudovibrio axinellae TaxID=989403 RepID=A0A166ABX5_9HYPH|nr:peptidoglycan-associated lipoprotein Pal [Pseudovibrio axinellae]KZL20847.1 Outer membrane lipoprotein Omp16 precursor [Pseudovibrio axinellae]SER20829.1 peptidoglycan-associated lipoprotein [Pseudovibrio axinellae]
MSKTLFARGARFAAVLGLCLIAAACAQTRPELTGNSSVVAGSGQDFVVNVGDRVFFLNNQSSLNGAARAVLDKQAQWLQHYKNYSVTIEGHADERGTRQYNIALGARRAAAVREYLVAKGVSPTRLKTISYGKERPVAVCNAASCWSQNRRAVTVLSGQ